MDGSGLGQYPKNQKLSEELKSKKKKKKKLSEEQDIIDGNNKNQKLSEELKSKKEKKKKLSEEQDIIDGNNKWLGNLPNEILRYIISLLPTKDAVGTSILCKRWEHLWKSTPNLEFRQGLPAKRKLFMNFVERVLLLRDSSDIKRFTLCCDVLFDTSHVNAWISAAIWRNVQELEINLGNFKEPYSLPHCLFTSVALTKLVLGMPYTLKVPPTTCFSNLKTLGLRGIIFSDDYSTRQLFSGFPVLEVMNLYMCNWKNLKVASICAPKLLHLTIIERCYQRRGDWDDCEVMIFGLVLKCFDYSGRFFNDYCFYNSCSLKEANIDVQFSDENPDESSCSLKGANIDVQLSDSSDVSSDEGSDESSDEGFDERYRQGSVERSTQGSVERSTQVAYRMYKLFRGLSTVQKLKLSFTAVEVCFPL
jgi:hypothetical protein